MIDFNTRSAQKEFLDETGIPAQEIRKNMQELEYINTRLGGHSTTINGMRELIEKHLSKKNPSPLSICEIGCGGGDNLAAICRWAKRKLIDISCIGIDINPDCIQYAVIKNAGLPITFTCADYRDGLQSGTKPAIIFSSLFCHHFTNGELVDMLKWMKENSTTGFMINDLHRHPIAYYSIKILTKTFSRSYLVKNDAPLSVLRGFKKSEWQNLFERAGIKNYSIQWKWAFRHLIKFMHQ